MSHAERRLAVATATCLVLAALGWILSPTAFHAGWLAAFVLVASWPLGSLALLLIHALTGGQWGEAVTPGLLLGVRAMPVLLLGLVPLLIGLPSLYEWARPGPALPNAFYLNLPFFAARGLVYLAVWFALAAAVLRGLAPLVAAPGLFALALTVSFAAIDTTMSLDPRFSSSIHGMLAACESVLLALSAAILASGLAAPPAQRADLGKLLLALSITWLYLDFMQLLIVWQSNLGNEAPWFLAHGSGLWGWVWTATALLHAIIPGVLMLSPARQRARTPLLAAALSVLAGATLRAWWTVLPASRGVPWIDVAAMAGLAGAAVLIAQWAHRRAREPNQVRHV